MINDKSLGLFKPLDNHLLRPIYADYSFGNIPTTIHYLLTGEQRGPLLPADCFGGQYPQPRKIVLFFIDSFGWAFWERFQERFRTTRAVVERGILTPLSALFPSTTSASVSTMNLGVLPAQHGLYEWNIYIPAYGQVIQSLPFTPLGRHLPDTCLRLGCEPGQLLTASETVYQRLAAHGVRSIQFANRSYAHSSYNTMTSRGAEIVTHSTLAEALIQIKETLPTITGKALLGFYWPDIDSVAHHYGPGTAYHEAETINFWTTFDALIKDLAGAEETLFLFTADHGQVYADAGQTLYLNRRFPELADILPTSPTGHPIYPNGSPRDLFLHVRPERREATLQLLNQQLAEIAMVMTVDQALAEGLLGPPPYSSEFRRRLGDILVLPHAGQFISWYEPELLENRFYGHHGGLARDELLTVLGVIDAL